MMGFNVDVLDGDPVQIEIVYYTDELAGTFTPLKLNNDGELVGVVGADIFDATRNSEHVVVVQYSAIDGGQNDQDGVLDGTITDPIGLGVAAPAAVTTTTTSQGQVIPAPKRATGSLSATGSNAIDILLFGLLVSLFGFAMLIFAKTRVSKAG